MLPSCSGLAEVATEYMRYEQQRAANEAATNQRFFEAQAAKQQAAAQMPLAPFAPPAPIGYPGIY